jgi:hypothetical protein
MLPADRQAVESTQVRLRDGFKTWFEVIRNGEVIGYVTTRHGGQLWRSSPMADWQFAASDWNRGDPAHGHAVLALLKHVEEIHQTVPLPIKYPTLGRNHHG